MKRIFSFLVIALAILSCSDENPGSTSRAFYKNSQLTLSDNPGVYLDWTEGDKTVFRFGLTHPDDKNISDDELTEYFWIEVPSNISAFEIENFEPSENSKNIYYTRNCFCFIPEAFQFEKAQVTGTKISANRWRISFDIVAVGEDNTYVLKDSGEYGLGSIDFTP